MGKAVEIPFAYGDVIAITGTGPRVVMWLKDPTGIVRGVLIDLTDPANPQVAREEVVIRRKTEGNVRKKTPPPTS